MYWPDQALILQGGPMAVLTQFARCTASLALLTCLAAPVGAQDDRRVEDQPEGEPAVRGQERLLVDEQELRRAGFGATLLREGALLPKGKGRLRSLASGHWVFVFDRDTTSGVPLPPMVLLPCMNLSAMEQLVQGRDDDVRFVISGQVFVYKGRNYLLPTSHAIETLDKEPGEESEPVEEIPLGDPDDPLVEDLIRQLEEATPRRREIVPPPAGASARLGLRREGTLLRLRRGRVSPTARGEWLFTIDNDVESPLDVDAPMRLLPCQNLEGVEELMASYKHELTFKMSGRVFVYDGMNYLLPTMFVVDFDPSSNLVLGQ